MFLLSSRRSKLMLIIFVVISLNGCDSEKRDWEKALELDSYQAYSDYLAEHPEGNHAEQADSLADGKRWQRCLTNEDRQSYEYYLSNYPQGLLNEEAFVFIDKTAWTEAETENAICKSIFLLRWSLT